MGESQQMGPTEDTLLGFQPAPVLYTEAGAPGLVQPGQGGAWGHLSAATVPTRGCQVAGLFQRGTVTGQGQGG